MPDTPPLTYPRRVGATVVTKDVHQFNVLLSMDGHGHAAWGDGIGTVRFKNTLAASKALRVLIGPAIVPKGADQ